ncbi:outer membrane chaperone Skp [Tabrizicola sp. TH137]|uniref:OmpH family outer membrane protein n=1 Tax=Tabrizicola sp. TH137 TaxID=2067452 RepID=UPI000C7D3BD1|nr:OmpH family outer membrane protein [Tabrizicola sp. TH137]PLL13521.1 outer membrane chaperone Skp [Tabrizicola sp. TH137]
MAGLRHGGLWRPVLAALALLAAQPVAAQQAQGAGEAVVLPRAPILTLDRNRLLAETRFGRALETQFQTDSEVLIAENLRLEQALESEERALTDRRPSLPAEEFRKLAEEFDAKTEAIRAAQDAKSRAITSRRDAERQRFLQAAIPVLADLMRDTGAVAIFDKETVILSLRGVDITDEAIARIDAVLGDGSDLDAAPEAGPEPAPEAAPVAPVAPAPAPAPGP